MIKPGTFTRHHPEFPWHAGMCLLARMHDFAWKNKNNNWLQRAPSMKHNLRCGPVWGD